MTVRLARYSEPYRASGGLAAVGVLNQLGRPDVEPLEVLVREAVQNCWDARVRPQVTVEIGRTTVGPDRLPAVQNLLSDVPPGIPLDEALTASPDLLYFADFGTHGLRGPVRADHPGQDRDFVDFVLNIGQPPDKELGGGSFGYGKAAFYLASGARTVVIDTLCLTDDGTPERRLIGYALGPNFSDDDGRLYTGRHWWGVSDGDVCLPVTGAAAEEAASLLGLPERHGLEGLGTTVAVVAPDAQPQTDGVQSADDQTMRFLAEAMVWNFWPRMITTPGADRATLLFRLTDNGRRLRVPDPRTHPRLRGFVEAMDRMRLEPEGDDDFILDRSVESRRPIKTLGRIVIAKGPVAPLPPATVPLTHGARVTAESVHHVALMRAPEIVVRYLPGEPSAHGGLGYSGVFRCAVDLDDAFKAAEPPAHDDWVARSVADPGQRSSVTVALRNIRDICREAAGHRPTAAAPDSTAALPLGEFADALAVLIPAFDGPGARRPGPVRAATDRNRRPSRPGRNGTPAPPVSDNDWADTVHDGPAGDGSAQNVNPAVDGAGGTDDPRTKSPARRLPSPQIRVGALPTPALTDDGRPVMRYPFQLRGRGNNVTLSAAVEVMTTDGRQTESEPPLGEELPGVLAWHAPDGTRHDGPTATIGPDRTDGAWKVDVELTGPAMLRLDIQAVPETVA